MTGGARGGVERVQSVALVAGLVVLAAVLGGGTLRQSVVLEGTRWFVLPHDDAMISMRYAQNLAHGVGLVWNAGERVQGYTNLGWTLLMAGVHAVGVPERLASLPLELLALAAHLAATALAAVFVRKRVGAAWALVVAAAVGFAPDAASWATTGWEVSASELAWTVALLGVVASSDGTSEDADAARRRAVIASLAAAALAAFLRLDGALLLAFVEGYALVVGARERDGRVVLAAILALAVPVAVVLWSHAYYGDWLPNTARLKRSTGMPSVILGVRYVGAFLAEPIQGAAAVLGGAWCVQRMRDLGSRHARAAAIALAGFLVAWLAYVVSVGGDCFHRGRFLVPLLPTLASLGALVAAPRFARPDGASVRAALVIAGCALGATESASFERVIDYEAKVEKDSNRIELVSALVLRRAALPADAVVGVFMAGTIPYFNEGLRFHDMLGKCDRRIAGAPARNPEPGHNRWDYGYTLREVRPDLLVTSELPRRPPAMNEETFAPRDGYNPDLYDKRAFQEHYAGNRMRVQIGAERAAPWIELYGRDESPYLARFERAGGDCLGAQ